MKGKIFIELLKMAEQAFGEQAVDTILDKADLPSKGVYTTVGTYSCSELVTLVMAFSEHSGLPPEALQRSFGHWMMKVFATGYPEFFKDKTRSFQMLEAVENEIHVEVRKLYKNVELPTFETEANGERELNLIYSSPRPLAPFCHGLIEACIEHFNETAAIAANPVTDRPNSTAFQITLTT